VGALLEGERLQIEGAVSALGGLAALLGRRLRAGREGGGRKKEVGRAGATEA